MRAYAVALTLLFAPLQVVAQAVEVYPRFQSYSFSEASAVGIAGVSLLSMPVSVVTPLGSFGKLSFGGALASGNLRGEDGETTTISGLTDGAVGLTFSVGGRSTLSLTGFLPAGATELSAGEAAVAGTLASQLLPFAVNQWGGGGGVSADLAAVLGRGPDQGLLASAGVTTGASYTPMAGDPVAYKPPDELRGSILATMPQGIARVATIRADVALFTSARVDAIDMFKPGVRVGASGSYSFPFGLGRVAIVHGGIGLRFGGDLTIPPHGFGDLSPGELCRLYNLCTGQDFGLRDPFSTVALAGAGPTPRRQLFYLGSRVNLEYEGVTFMPDAEVRLMRVDDGIGQGWISSLGGRAEVRLAGRKLGRRLLLLPAARVRFGSVLAHADATSAITGWEIGAGLRWEAGR